MNKVTNGATKRKPRTKQKETTMCVALMKFKRKTVYLEEGTGNIRIGADGVFLHPLSVAMSMKKKERREFRKALHGEKQFEILHATLPKMQMKDVSKVIEADTSLEDAHDEQEATFAAELNQMRRDQIR